MLPMRKPFKFRQALGAVVCLLGMGAAQAAAPDATPAEAFFRNPAFGMSAIAPDGRHVAFLTGSATQRMQLAVLDTENLTIKVAAGFTDYDIAFANWVNDKRLVFGVTDSQTAVGDRYRGTGLFAVDADGSELRALTVNARSGGALQLGLYATMIGATHDPKSDDIFVVRPHITNLREADALDLFRVNTRTGHVQLQDRPGKSFIWSLDEQDVPRATVTREGHQLAFHYRDPASGKWTRLAEWDRVSGSGFFPAGFGRDGTMYVASRSHRDTTAIYRYDFARHSIEAEPLVSTQGYDFNGNLLIDQTGVVGVRYWTDGQATLWFDPRLKEVQAKIDALFPGTINTITIPYRGEVPIVMVHVFSDVQPGMLLLFNTKTEKLVRLGTAMPAIDPHKMAHRELVHYKARDGLEIPAWLTLPPGAKSARKLPMVMLVHGGPWVRARPWSWDADSQFLASRGYAVLEPDFRGSTGHGWRHFRASWKQWGLAMQDDVADGARWAIAQGTADPSRICIAGASYGGYATLMGLVNDPDLYRCGIDWLGVTDVELMYSISWSDASEDFKSYGMPELIGDPDKDAEQLKATSPLQQAARIKAPLLLAYGGSDRRVPIDHGTKFRNAVQKTNPDVEWVEYREEGHGWLLVKNRVDFWSRVEKFLDRNIGTK